MQHDNVITKSGFSIVELLVALSIIAIVTGIILTTFVSFRKIQALDKDTETVVEILRQARSQTLSSRNATQYGVHIAAPTITLFSGTTYSAGASDNQNFALSSSDTILTVNLTGGGSNIVFSRLSGETTQNGTVVVSSPATSQTKTVTIYKTGLVEFQ